jgi:alcohol dehydrogenase class IV
MTLTANWSYPTADPLRRGPHRRTAAWPAPPRVSRTAPAGHRPGLAGLPITARALDIMDAAGLGRAIFAEVDPNPTEVNLAAGVEAFGEGNHDGVIAFGGGSGLDLGKLVAFMAGQTRPVWDFEDIGDWWRRADAAAIRPIVAVPTTAGTGSEVGRAGVLTNSARRGKEDHLSPQMPARRGHLPTRN